MDPASLRLGVDLGGTKTEGVVVRLDPTVDGPPEVLSRVRIPTERDAGYDAIVERVADLIDRVAKEAGLLTPPPIGVGMPGSVTRSEEGVLLTKNSNTTCLNGRPFRDDLAQAVGRPVRFANDANCFALAEARFGSGRAALPEGGVVFGAILGTGVGGGIVLNGSIWEGRQGIAGEWGHIVLHEGGAPCYCGRSGCVERYLSGPAIEEAYAQRTGQKRRLSEIAGRAEDPGRDALFAEVAKNFGRAMATVINILDPDLVVLGGGVSNLPLFYGAGIEAVRREIFNDRLDTILVKHQLGDSAGVLGAAILWDQPG